MMKSGGRATAPIASTLGAAASAAFGKIAPADNPKKTIKLEIAATQMANTVFIGGLSVAAQGTCFPCRPHGCPQWRIKCASNADQRAPTRLPSCILGQNHPLSPRFRRPQRGSAPPRREAEIRTHWIVFTNGSSSMGMKGMRMQDHLGPAVVAIVEVLVRVGRLIQRQLMRNDQRRIGLAEVNEVS